MAGKANDQQPSKDKPFAVQIMDAMSDAAGAMAKAAVSSLASGGAAVVSTAENAQHAVRKVAKRTVARVKKPFAKAVSPKKPKSTVSKRTTAKKPTKKAVAKRSPVKKAAKKSVVGRSPAKKATARKASRKIAKKTRRA